jgi:hypothetical protein
LPHAERKSAKRVARSVKRNDLPYERNRGDFEM